MLTIAKRQRSYEGPADWLGRITEFRFPEPNEILVHLATGYLLLPSGEWVDRFNCPVEPPLCRTTDIFTLHETVFVQEASSMSVLLDGQEELLQGRSLYAPLSVLELICCDSEGFEVGRVSRVYPTLELTPKMYERIWNELEQELKQEGEIDNK